MTSLASTLLARARARARRLLPAAPSAPAAAAAALAFLTLGAGAARSTTASVSGVAGVTGGVGPLARPEVSPPGAATGRASCPAGSLPDHDSCVRWASSDDDAPEAASFSNAHHDKRGRWIAYDQIPRRPDRPSDYDAYRYPVACERSCVVSGYDLDRPDEQQRRGRRLLHVGHGAVDLVQKKGTPVALVDLEHQQGEAEAVYVGPLFGTTVITRHTLHEGGQLHDYLLLYGHLDTPAAGLGVGAKLREGDLVGYVGDTGSPELVHLHLEARRVRSGVDVTKLSPAAMIANESSVVCDPRNILPLR
jgi:hypothetical protein